MIQIPSAVKDLDHPTAEWIWINGNQGMMGTVEFLPLPHPRPTVDYANCTVSEPLGYRPLHLDLHLPPGDGPFPVIAWIHGGGWQSGSRIELPATITPHRFHERLLARGYAVADVDYRLVLEAQYPAQQADVSAAIQWLRHHAAALRLDPARFAAMGESAGAHLAAMAGLAGEVQAVVDWYGPARLDFRNNDDPSTSPAMLLGGPLSGRLAFAHWASPLYRVHAGAPPFLAMHGTDDEIVPFEQSVLLAEALRAVGVRCDLHPVEGAGHCFEGYDDIGGLIEASADFLDEVLK